MSLSRELLGVIDFQTEDGRVWLLGVVGRVFLWMSSGRVLMESLYVYILFSN